MLNFLNKNTPIVNQRIMVDNNGQIIEIDPNDFLREYGVTWTDEVIWGKGLTNRYGRLKSHVKFLFKKEAEYWDPKTWTNEDRLYFGVKELQILRGYL